MSVIFLEGHRWLLGHPIPPNQADLRGRQCIDVLSFFFEAVAFPVVMRGTKSLSVLLTGHRQLLGHPILPNREALHERQCIDVLLYWL